MSKEELLENIETKIRLKSNDYYFLNDTGKCIEYALELDLNENERNQIIELKNRLNEVHLPHHTQFNYNYNEPVLTIIKDLENILVG